MALKPEASLAVSLAVAVGAYAVFQNFTPSIADIRSLDKGNKDVQASERGATWTAAALVGFVALLARDATVFVIGESVVVAMAWSHRHADQVDPVTSSARELPPTLASGTGHGDAGAIGTTPSGATQGMAQTQQAISYGASVL